VPTPPTVPPLAALRAFEAAGRLLSFTAAGDELGVTQSAISRQIGILEDHLHARLFKRLARAVSLTDVGEAYLRAVTHGFTHIEEATRAVTGRTERRVLTLSCLPTLAVSWVMPRLARFSGEHRGVEIRLTTSIHSADLRRGTTDIAIRVGSPTRSATKGRPRIDLKMTEQTAGLSFDYLFPDVLVPVCAPALLKHGAPLARTADLRHHTIIHNATRPHAWADWLLKLGAPRVTPKSELSFGHFFMGIQAASEARGVALVPLILVIEALRAESLVIPFRAAVESDGAYYLLCRRDDQLRPEYQLLRGWLLREAQRSRKECRRLLRIVNPSAGASR
jgi:LysR family transcriptional regulator, glycine cleavage system transcriptional activator